MINLINYYNKYCFITFLFIIASIFIIPQFISRLYADGKKEQIVISSSSSSSQEKAPEQAKKLHITSDNMFVEKESSTIVFSGNVIATQGESVIKADKISVLLFSQKEKQDNQSKNIKHEIKSLTASGGVNFKSGNKTASADEAIYTSIDQKIVLTGGSPRVMTGNSYVTGKKIILFQDSGKVIVEGGKERRVEALFDSKDDFKQDNL